MIIKTALAFDERGLFASAHSGFAVDVVHERQKQKRKDAVKNKEDRHRPGDVPEHTVEVEIV